MKSAMLAENEAAEVENMLSSERPEDEQLALLTATHGRRGDGTQLDGIGLIGAIPLIFHAALTGNEEMFFKVADGMSRFGFKVCLLISRGPTEMSEKHWRCGGSRLAVGRLVTCVGSTNMRDFREIAEKIDSQSTIRTCRIDFPSVFHCVPLVYTGAPGMPFWADVCEPWVLFVRCSLSSCVGALSSRQSSSNEKGSGRHIPLGLKQEAAIFPVDTLWF